MSESLYRRACIASTCAVILIPAILVMTSAVHAQTSNAATTSSSGMPVTAASGAVTGQMLRADAGLLRDIAHANLAEIATGQLALGKATNPKVKEFAQQMVDDHTKALADVNQLAQTKSVKLPTEPDVKHKAAMAKLKMMNGESFDRSYVKTAGVSDHVATEKLLKKTQSSAQNADVKALADKMLPVVQGHLTHARELDGMKK